MDSTNRILAEACAHVGVSTEGAVQLWEHATTVFLLPSHEIVARISKSADDRKHAQTTVALTRWLVTQGFPATAPADVDQPVEVEDAVVTFWQHYPQDERPRPNSAELGSMLRKLHALPEPPVRLEAYQPLQTLGDTIEASTWLPRDKKSWLSERRLELLELYRTLHFPLGRGFIHGDAYPGNTLWDGSRAILGDWDEAGIGPREIDLTNTHQGARFGRTSDERDAFTSAYGYDITAWSGFPVLREMRDLHTLGAYIRRADGGSGEAAQELTFRLETLIRGDATARWNAR